MRKFELKVSVKDTVLIQEEYTFDDHRKLIALLERVSDRAIRTISTLYHDSMVTALKDELKARGEERLNPNSIIIEGSHNLMKIATKGYLDSMVAVVLEYNFKQKLMVLTEPKGSELAQFADLNPVVDDLHKVEVVCKRIYQ